VQVAGAIASGSDRQRAPAVRLETLALRWTPVARLPAALLDNHRIRIRGARRRRRAAFIHQGGPER
jgi:hypothetical protein